MKVKASQKPLRTLLLILDGFGIGTASSHNAIENAHMPFYRSLLKKYPHSSLKTHGSAVGLPEGTMGNSEVGHLTLGAGRIIDQDLSRISRSIQTGAFFQNPILLQAVQNQKRVHLVGLLSDGGVHSHMDHLFALLKLCQQARVASLFIHAFLDGRDAPPQSGALYLQRLLDHPLFQHQNCQLTSLSGRYWAMDRDQRWERTNRAYEAMIGKAPNSSLTPLEALQNAYQQHQTDEFFEPLCLTPEASIQEGDSLVFFNFRADRARQLSQRILQQSPPKHFVSLTHYEDTLPVTGVAFPPQRLRHLFPEVLASHHKKQLRMAETEKYAHVTFFFNGGREEPFTGETRFLVPSPKDVSTYDLKPEMSALRLAQEAKTRILKEDQDFILINFANADMVGHTGNYTAAVKAMDALDLCLKEVISTAEACDYSILLTADHGNAEELIDSEGRPHTQHTLNPVPLVWISKNSPGKNIQSGSLVDIMPTLCTLMDLPIPREVTGKSLIIIP